MADLMKDLQTFGDLTSNFTPLDVLVVFGLSLFLTLVLGWAYRATHKGVSYSMGFVHTLVILGVVTAFLMLIIGSNVARAFTLVGTMSIIRFRHAIKETRDIGFLFMAMAIGMACGTRFYLLAVFATVCLLGTVILLEKLSVFEKVVRERILIVRVGAEANFEELFADVFRTHLDESHLISVESVEDVHQEELIYSVVLRRSANPAALLTAIRGLNGNKKVSLVLGQQELDL